VPCWLPGERAWLVPVPASQLEIGDSLAGRLPRAVPISTARGPRSPEAPGAAAAHSLRSIHAKSPASAGGGRAGLWFVLGPLYAAGAFASLRELSNTAS